MYNLFLTHHTHSWPGRRPRRPTQAYEDETKMKKGPNDARCVVWAIGEVFFECTIYFFPPTFIVGPDDAHEGPRRPTQAYEDETKMKKGPNDASSVVWAIGEFFFECTIYFLPTTPIVGPDDAHEGPRRPTAANKGQRRPTKMKRR